MTLIANHLWQSTIAAAFVALLTLACRANRAQVRHWLWVAASVKFLIPFSLLIGAASEIGSRTGYVPAAPHIPAAMVQASQPFAVEFAAPYMVQGSQQVGSIVFRIAPERVQPAGLFHTVKGGE